MKMFIFLAVAAFCFQGCFSYLGLRSDANDFPENIYVLPEVNSYGSSTVGIFRFIEPPNLHGAGTQAAETVYNELLKNRIFSRITSETDYLPQNLKKILRFAKKKGYDLIITGEIFYYFDGSSSMPVHVAESIRVVHVLSGSTVWYAKAIDKAPPVYSSDYIFFKLKGASAPPASLLFERNAKKFCSMIKNMPAQVEGDADQDGISDKTDRCAKTPVGVNVDQYGCPEDTDNDGVYDYLDKCPCTVADTRVNENGCPVDSDNDGVCDYLDKCPDTPEESRVNLDGCPVDTDNDGVYDYLDKCPCTVAGTRVNENGCPVDSDNDGVYDYLDKCPDTPEGASVGKNGCWIVKWEEPLFDLNKSTIKPEAYPALKSVLKILKKNPALKVMIKGHTDNTGTRKFNQTLSQKRAKEVVKYFLNSGISKERLSHKGLGASAPLNSNNTELERAANRRVEIEPVQSFSKK